MTHNPTPPVDPARFTAVEAWLAKSPCFDAAQQQTSPIDVVPSLSLGTCEEVPVRFGQDSNIFGMFCQPLVITGTPVAALLSAVSTMRQIEGIGERRTLVSSLMALEALQKG